MNLPSQHSQCLKSSCVTSFGDNHYAQYDNPNKAGTSYLVWSFQDLNNTLCLRCGSLGHPANTCHSPSNCSDHQTIVNWRNGCLINKANVAICVIFNVKGPWTGSSWNHVTHSCSLCGNSAHGATGCPQNWARLSLVYTHDPIHSRWMAPHATSLGHFSPFSSFS